MIEKYVRPYYQALLVDPLARALFAFSPSLITLLGCLLGVAAAVFIALNRPFTALTFLLLSGFCDTLDGTLARLRKKTSAIGTVWDITSDRIVEAAIVIGLFLYSPASRGLLCLLMLASILICITSFLVVGLFSENQSNKSFHYSPGLIERPEAFFFFAMMILLPAHFLLISSLFTLLVFATAAIRLVQFANIWGAR